jgi:plasmid stabilization system protein ParE
MKNKEYSLFWTHIAQIDLENIIDYISEDSIDNALHILNTIRIKAEGLINLPHRGRIVPELKYHNITNYRELIINPWRIIYRIDDVRVYIIATFDGRRNFEDILLERIIKNIQ